MVSGVRALPPGARVLKLVPSPPAVLTSRGMSSDCNPGQRENAGRGKCLFTHTRPRSLWRCRGKPRREVRGRKLVRGMTAVIQAELVRARVVWGPGVVSAAGLSTVARVNQECPWVVMVHTPYPSCGAD